MIVWEQDLGSLKDLVSAEGRRLARLLVFWVRSGYASREESQGLTKLGP